MDAEQPKPETILEEAARITTSDRQRYYGHPLDNHQCTADMVHAYLVRRGWIPPVRGRLTARDWCMMSVLQKVSRDANSTKRDNLVDGAGYFRNAEQIEVEYERRELQCSTPGCHPKLDGEGMIEHQHPLYRATIGPDGKLGPFEHVDEHDHGRPDGWQGY